MEHVSDDDTSCKLRARYSDQRLGKVPRRFGNLITNGDSIIKIGHNIVKSPGNLRRLTVTQIPVRNHQLMLI